MHRTRGRVARRHQHTSPAKTPKAARVGVHGYDVLAAEFDVRQSSRLSAASAAASPDAARVAGVRHSQRLSAASAAASPDTSDNQPRRRGERRGVGRDAQEGGSS